MKRLYGTYQTSSVSVLMAVLTRIVRYPPTDEVFFVQNAGALAAGTGLKKSSIIQKISLAEAEVVRNSSNPKIEITVTTVPSHPQVINPNGIAPESERHATKLC